MGGELARLIIRGYEKEEELSQQSSKPKAEFEAMFNPENFAIGNTFEFDDKQSDGETGSEQKYKNLGPQEFSFEIIIDATGASGEKKEVEDEIRKFRAATGFQGAERRPLFLIISWGILSVRCVMKKMEVKYSLFRNDGTPVRCTISFVCAEYKTPAQQLADNPERASKLTRVLDNNWNSDSLELLAHKSYGNSNNIAALANANGLNSLKNALPDTGRLELPSVDQLKNQMQDSAINQAENLTQQGISNLF